MSDDEKAAAGVTVIFIVKCMVVKSMVQLVKFTHQFTGTTKLVFACASLPVHSPIDLRTK